LRDVEVRTVVLVLPHDEEALKVKDNAGNFVESKEEGYELKGEAVNLSLAQMGLGETTVLFFNSKQDALEGVRDALVAKVAELRRIYCARIAQLVQAVDLVIENQENEEVRLVFEEVGRHLLTWVESHRELGWDGLAVQEPLIIAINNTHPKTIWAAVRRYGEWSNLDYYHQLGFGARRIAVTVIGRRIEEFKIIVQNLIRDDQLEPARMFLNGVLARLDDAVGEVFKRMQFAGSEVFKTDVQRDFVFWNKCDNLCGKGYRTAIRDYTAQQFAQHYDDAHLLIKQMVNREWEKVIALLCSMIRDEGKQLEGACVRADND